MTSLTQALHEIHPALPTAGGLFLLLALAFVAHFLARFVLQRAVQAFTRRTSATWDGAFAEEKFFAMTAVLLLVFRDTILGLVASVQLTAQDMVRVGDWIEMPRYNADGDVIDVALHTVTVQNWDKTITNAWEAYENTQGDIFDHVLAVTGEFGLHLFQNPTGQDIRRAFPARQEA